VGTPKPSTVEAMEFASASEWEKWLAKNHAKSTGVWIRFFRKNMGVVSISNSDALDVALCYGWRTGQAKRYDDRSWLGRFVPRRPKSIWSKINTRRAERLIEEGRMKPAGIKQVEEAKKDGRWERAYSPPSEAKVPDDFLKELAKNRKANGFFHKLDKTNVYSIVFRVENTKSSELRRAKVREIVEMLERGEKFH
jgi:uncharacterized protein YdeI (YjbR/CyaY-like superfamily)